MKQELDIAFARKQFPALAGDWVLFDNAGGSQTLKQVADRMFDYLLTSNVQLGASYDVSQVAGQRVEEGLQAIVEMIGAEDKGEVILGASTSLLLKILSLSLVETFNSGDEVIVTNCDHEANIGPWRALKKRGIIVKEWRINPETLELHLEDLDVLMTEKTRLVALTHASNILGTLNPIKKISSFIHERGALVCVDGVAYAPHRRVDVKDLDVDFYAFSFYKVYGPHYSVLYGKKSLLEKLPGINHFFLEDIVPYKFQPGGVNYELTYSLLGLKDYFTRLAREHAGGEKKDDLGMTAAVELAYELFARHEEKLCTRFLDFLNSKSQVRIIGGKTADRHIRVPTISFVKETVKSSFITQAVDKHRIGIRHGDFYARRLIHDLGLAPLDGVVRVSMVHYNTIDEVDRLIAVLDSLV